MHKSHSRFLPLEIAVLLLIAFASGARASELTVQIRSPKDGAEIIQDQSYVLIGGKVASKTGGSGYVDIFLVLDVSASTAHYAGVEFPEFYGFPNFYYHFRSLPCKGMVRRSAKNNLRNSIFAAEIVASRRLLSQLNPQTTRVGVITFSGEIWLRQRLTHDFEEVRSALDFIYKQKPNRGRTW